MRIVSIFLATLVLIFSLSACQIVNEEELATIREEGYQQGKESAERDSASALSAQYDAGHEEGYQAGYQKGREDGLKEAAQKAKADKAKEESKPQSKTSTAASSSGNSTTTSQGTQTATVYVTDTGSKYHRYGCRYLRESCHARTLSQAKAIRLVPFATHRHKVLPVFRIKIRHANRPCLIFMHYSTGSKLSWFVS